MEEIINAMCLTGPAAEIQRAQTAHRLRLIDFWGIPVGSRVLEIGCGQGDTLAALAYAVGERGTVYGIDIAGPDYGCPETLGQARARLMGGPLGARIRMEFETDVLDERVCFGENAFDVVVLAHALWYLADEQTLVRILARVRPWARRLCLAEWSAAPVTAAQWPHYTAVVLQALCGSCVEHTQLNIRTLLYPSRIKAAVRAAGWEITAAGTIPSTGMQDGAWERDTALAVCPALVERAPQMPEGLRTLLAAQLDALAEADSVEPLDTLCICAENPGAL